MALRVMPYAVDPEAADGLWSLSEQLLGLGQQSCMIGAVNHCHAVEGLRL